MTKDQMVDVLVDGISVVFERTHEDMTCEQFLYKLMGKRDLDVLEVDKPDAEDPFEFVVSVIGREDNVRLFLNDVGLGHTQGYVWVRVNESKYNTEMLRCACVEHSGSQIHLDD